MRNLDDAAAYMLLVTSNAQSELTALERGRHALHSRMEIKAYAESVGREKQWRNVYNEVYAAEVMQAVAHVCNDLSEHFRTLVEIHAAPSWLWPALVEAMLKDEWTVNTTRERIGAGSAVLWIKTDNISLDPCTCALAVTAMRCRSQFQK